MCRDTPRGASISCASDARWCCSGTVCERGCRWSILVRQEPGLLNWYKTTCIDQAPRSIIAASKAVGLLVPTNTELNPRCGIRRESFRPLSSMLNTVAECERMPKITKKGPTLISSCGGACAMGRNGFLQQSRIMEIGLVRALRRVNVHGFLNLCKCWVYECLAKV